MYDLGHRKIAYLGGKEVLADNSVYFEERKDTFINFCQEHSIDHKSLFMEGDYSAESGYNMTKQMIADGDLPTAIFSASDPLAIGAMRAYMRMVIKFQMIYPSLVLMISALQVFQTLR